MSERLEERWPIAEHTFEELKEREVSAMSFDELRAQEIEGAATRKFKERSLKSDEQLLRAEQMELPLEGEEPIASKCGKARDRLKEVRGALRRSADSSRREQLSKERSRSFA